METVPRIFAIVPTTKASSNVLLNHWSWLVEFVVKLRTAHIAPKAMPFSKLRLRVFSRDCYRCRVCDQKGDEVTLLLHRIHPHVMSPDGFLTLCSVCETMVSSPAIEVESSAEFLRISWHRLHHSGSRDEVLRPYALPNEEEPSREGQAVLIESSSRSFSEVCL